MTNEQTNLVNEALQYLTYCEANVEEAVRKLKSARLHLHKLLSVDDAPTVTDLIAQHASVRKLCEHGTLIALEPATVLHLLDMAGLKPE